MKNPSSFVVFVLIVLQQTIIASSTTPSYMSSTISSRKHAKTSSNKENYHQKQFCTSARRVKITRKNYNDLSQISDITEESQSAEQRRLFAEQADKNIIKDMQKRVHFGLFGENTRRNQTQSHHKEKALSVSNVQKKSHITKQAIAMCAHMDAEMSARMNKRNDKKLHENN